MNLVLPHSEKGINLMVVDAVSATMPASVEAVYDAFTDADLIDQHLDMPPEFSVDHYEMVSGTWGSRGACRVLQVNGTSMRETIFDARRPHAFHYFVDDFHAGLEGTADLIVAYYLFLPMGTHTQIHWEHAIRPTSPDKAAGIEEFVAEYWRPWKLRVIEQMTPILARR